jgi:hypothetical protein
VSGRELDADGTDGYHPQHPWESVGHPLYIAPDYRGRDNWPPVEATPAGPAELARWKHLPKHAKTPRHMPTFARGRGV